MIARASSPRSQSARRSARSSSPPLRRAGGRVRIQVTYGGHAWRDGLIGSTGVNWYSNAGTPVIHTFAQPYGARIWWPCNDRPDDKAIVSLTVTPQNDAPVAVADSAVVAEGGNVVINVAANDSDVDDGLDLTSIAIVENPNPVCCCSSPESTSWTSVIAVMWGIP